MTTVSRRIILLIAVVALPFVLGACYTLFQHSRVSQLNYARPTDGCVDCHSKAQIHEFLHTQSTVSSSDVWDEFYNEPWWNDRYLHADSARTDGTKKNGDDGS